MNRKHDFSLNKLVAGFVMLTIVLTPSEYGKNVMPIPSPGIFIESSLINQRANVGGITSIVSNANDGSQGNSNSYSPSISADGRYIAFRSEATNLVAGDTNEVSDIFVHDQQTGQKERVSITNDGTQSNGDSYLPRISANGRYVAFYSMANNLVEDDTNEAQDIFVFDRDTRIIELVSLASNGDQGNKDSRWPSISQNGRYVAFYSFATNLVDGDTNGHADVFVHDRNTGQTELISISSTGVRGDSFSRFPSISADGRYVAFDSNAPALAIEDNNGHQDILVHDRNTKQTELVSKSSEGVLGNGTSATPSLSSDGRYVAFISAATNLVSGDNNNIGKVFVLDRYTKQIELVSKSSEGVIGNVDSYEPAISANGLYVSFVSDSSNLVSRDTNDTLDIFVHNRLSGQTERVSISSDGLQANHWSLPSTISADGQFVAFSSLASNLVEGDTNGDYDVFVHDRGTGSGTYSISGQVTDGNNDPVAGVTLSLGIDSTTTDASGYYTLTNLITGTYTITPSKTDYSFNPPSQSVTLPPDAPGVDFLGSSEKRPVILIPGLGASLKWPCLIFGEYCLIEGWTWMPIPWELSTAEKYYDNLINQFENARYDDGDDGYSEENGYFSVLFYNWSQPLDQNIQRLDDRIDQLMNQTGAHQVDLIGHSMGGLVARAYIQSSQYDFDVANVITIGSPHKGASKAYPPWTGGVVYDFLPIERLGLSVLLARGGVPSLKDILPSSTYVDLYGGELEPGYLYDEELAEQPLKLETDLSMINRNIYLSTLNSNLSEFLDRTQVCTIAEDSLNTPTRFYVHDPDWWESHKWEDGEPNWDRIESFKSINGDGTVTADSASLPTSCSLTLNIGVNHIDLPDHEQVIREIFTRLNIPILPPMNTKTEVEESTTQQVMILTINGPGDAVVTDPLGNSVGPNKNTIPDAEYVSNPGDLYKLIQIPLSEGGYDIQVNGNYSGTYELSLLDTFNPIPEVVTDTLSLWDSSRSQIYPDTSVDYTISYTLATSSTTSLIAVTPVIQVPVRAGENHIHGRALPGKALEIREANTDTVLGSGIVSPDGLFDILLSSTLEINQRIYAWSEGVAGPVVVAEGFNIFLPLTRR